MRIKKTPSILNVLSVILCIFVPLLLSSLIQSEWWINSIDRYLNLGIVCGLVLGAYHLQIKAKGTCLTRDGIKSNVQFHLEKITGPGIERLYLLCGYGGKGKLFYTDTPEFENGWYMKKDEDLVRVTHVTEYDVPKEYC